MVRGIDGVANLFRAEAQDLPSRLSEEITGELLPREQVAPSDLLLPDFRVAMRRYALQQQFASTSADTGSSINGLRAGEPVAIRIEASDSQADVLRRAYTEYAKRAGLTGAGQARFVEQMMRTGGESIQHAGRESLFTDEEFAAQKASGTINMLPTEGQVAYLRQLKVEELLSYGLTDWAVTQGEEQQVIEIVRGDPNLSQTVRALNQSNYLGALIDRVDNNEQRSELINLLGSRLDPETARMVEPHIERLDVQQNLVFGGGGAVGEQTVVNQNLWQVRFNLARLGVTPATTGFDRAAYQDLISSNPSAPFSGVGATGTNPTETSVPLLDQWGLYRRDGETTARYTNPVPGSLSAYLDGVGEANRRRQAELLLNQPVSSTMTDVYGGRLPSRADVIRAAAARYNLDPRLLGAIILAEQRDQSQREDAKDYTAATSMMQGNTSIGLGQVVISTAQRNDLFSDLMSASTRSNLSHDDYARLLADDTVNIFAAAKYIRQVADQAATAPPEVQARFRNYFPGVDFSRYRENSAAWPLANIQSLGSEYTSAPWDVPKPGKTPAFVDSPGWGYFVGEAYRDVDAGGVFR